MLRKPIIAWALYDWGNSAFATSVMTVFFPLLFNKQWSAEATGPQTTSRLMIANGVASLVLAVTLPVLGAAADRATLRKFFLGLFAFAGAAITAMLYWIPSGAWLTAASAYAAAAVGFAAANVFYNAMLTDVTREKYFDRVSAFGFAAGYLGGGILLVVHLLMILRPNWFALSDGSQAMRVIFLTVGLWWALFTFPLLVVLKERQGAKLPLRSAVVEGLAQLRQTFRRIRTLRPVVMFLVAYWLYIDAVNTLIKAAVDFGYKLGFQQRDLITAVLIVQFISFPAALGFGWLSERIGPKRGVLLGLAIYVVVTVWAGFMEQVWEFYVLACAIGLAQGGVFSLSRSLYAKLIPPEESAEFFGFYNLMGKLAAVVGPFLIAGAATITGSNRLAVAAILPLLIGGALVLLKTPEDVDLSEPHDKKSPQ